MENFAFLYPSEIGAHPLIAYLEEKGAFGFKKEEIDKLVEDVKENDFLQPILVMPAPDGSDKKYLRVAGKMRVMAAETIGQTVPAYIREFPDDDAVLRAAKSENFKRRLWSIEKIHEEEKLIKKILSERSIRSYKTSRKLHPDLQKMCNQGVFRHYDGITNVFAKLSLDEQKDIADVIQCLKDAKIRSGSAKGESFELPDEIKEKLEKLAQEKLEFEEKELKYNKTVTELQDEINRLNENIIHLTEKMYEEKSKAEKDEEFSLVIESMKNQMKNLRTEVFNKEAEIQNLKNELYEAYQKTEGQKDDIRSERIKFMFDAINKAGNDVKELLALVEREVSNFFATSTYTKDTVLVLNDKIVKMWKTIDKERQLINSIVDQLLEKVEEKAAA
ncbi:MAG: ParB N-terminal domain-containing protein [Nitrospirae bacterium]|nr:ParB N-terminal domain-containing protein [Nitrospirota bacterium]